MPKQYSDELTWKWLAKHPSPLMTSGILILSKGRDVGIYVTTPEPSDFGLAFCLRKTVWDAERQKTKTAEVYDVNIDGKFSLCDCKGFLAHGTCRHVQALSAILAKEENY